MDLKYHRQESMLRVVLPPAVLVASVWAGFQILLLVYLRIVLLYPTTPGPPLGEFMTEVLSGSSAAGPALALGLLVVNLLFVVLIWLSYRSFRSRSRSEKVAAILTYGGATVLLVFLQWKWMEILRLAFWEAR
jgi:threonine/homoserine/homoserine lactone efflux protein